MGFDNPKCCHKNDAPMYEKVENLQATTAIGNLKFSLGQAVAKSDCEAEWDLPTCCIRIIIYGIYGI